MPNVIRGFHRFNPHTDYTEAQAAALAKEIDSCKVRIPDTQGSRYYLFQGWCFDIGNKPYLVQDETGDIVRHWGRSVGALRRSLHLTTGHRVVADPFEKGGS